MYSQNIYQICREASVAQSLQMGEPSKPRFVLLGAGLPRNGTLSTRAALGQLLGGEVYHMITVMRDRHDHHWRIIYRVSQNGFGLQSSTPFTI